MSISAMYLGLLRAATESGEAHSQTLRKGARLTVRARGRGVILTISRKKQRVGDTEIEVFKRDCGVPIDAERRPSEGQNSMEHDGETWWYVSYRWEE